MMKKFFLATLLILAACTPTAAPVSTPQVIKVHVTPAARPWLAEAYSCAKGLDLVLANINDPKDADISIRVGEPDRMSSPAYQIDQEDLLVVTHRESPLQNLALEDVWDLFSPSGSQDVQIWVFASGTDIQQVFVREVLSGQVVTSLARVALSPQQMSDTLNQDKNAVGILPRHWKAGTVRDIFTLPNVPVLAVVKSEPQGMLKTLLACLQK